MKPSTIMSTAFSNKALLAPTTSTSRVGHDPDGVVDNRPGISHPNMPRKNTSKNGANSRALTDLFCRDPQHGRELVNRTHKASGEHRDGKWVIGIGMRNPSRSKPKSVTKKRGRPSRYAESDELWTGAFEEIETIEDDNEPKDR